MKPVTVVVVGAGMRGQGYAGFIRNHPEAGKVVGVAEPRDFYRNKLIDEHGIPAENTFADWRDLAAADKMADAAIIGTQDAMHTEPAVALAKKGYSILLEKPMAPTGDECRQIVDAVKANGGIFAVGHVLRYTDYTTKLKELLDAGTIGEIVSLDRLEPVGYWHQAHSYVRGNWRNEEESSCMLLAKSCHDLDWIRYIMGHRCLRVSSFGGLFRFRSENKPEGAAGRCLDCGLEPECPYSAAKIYLRERLCQSWPTDILTPEVNEESVTEALRTGPYGRCVYACDNDVVDHQVVNMEFEGGRTASFTMTAFTEGAGRRTRIFGTHGMIEGDGRMIKVTDFLTDKIEEIDTQAADHSILGGHGGGDGRLTQAFLAAIANSDPSLVRSGPDETLESHLMVFAADKARVEGTVEKIEM